MVRVVDHFTWGRFIPMLEGWSLLIHGMPGNPINSYVFNNCELTSPTGVG